jgi:Domain of unknown function (DUF4349)/Putative zinc-finger
MKPSDHWLSGEELMAYLDGEAAPDRVGVIREHLASCDACRQMAADLQGVSSRLAQWEIEEPPATLRPRQPKHDATGWLSVFGRRRVSVLQLAFVPAALVLVVSVGRLWHSQARLAPPTVVGGIPRSVTVPEMSNEAATRPPRAAPSAPPMGEGQSAGGGINQTIEDKKVAAQGPLIARTAKLSIIATDFDAVRPALDRMLRDVGGFIGRIDISGSRGTPRALSASLRVPAPRLETALASLKKIGRVTGEAEAGDDVTEQVRDLDVRLANAKATEKRLVDVLEHRTGKVSDILEAEREIGRVRGEIEQMDAERKAFDRRVSYATVSLTVEEERKAELDLGALPPSARLRNALVDGIGGAFDSGFDAVLFVLASGPSLLLWALILAWPARLLWRRLRGAGLEVASPR